MFQTDKNTIRTSEYWRGNGSSPALTRRTHERFLADSDSDFVLTTINLKIKNISKDLKDNRSISSRDMCQVYRPEHP
ncbi:hypothetical protein DPMN_159022 [Dreissena polymorpha]|uniref:Uncharacterized protein n=1 Tax=Dreissena polymorpha TaxID=45954 RepID=A0A9D4EMH9_DREPO|nr:hypothetical protein DPMN_159022 [Dreissena polymorpha]